MKATFTLKTIFSIVLTFSTLSLFAQFSGYYDPSNWATVQAAGGNGTIATNAPTSIALTGPDNTSGGAATRYEITIPTNGTVSFDWSVSHQDPTYDDFGYWLNSTYNVITDNSGTGSLSIPVTNGQTFGFYGQSDDGCCGTFTATITNFSGPTAGGFNDAGIEEIQSPVSSFCADSTPVQVIVRNFGINQISPITVEWSVDGVNQTSFTYNGTLDTLSGVGFDTAHLTIGTYFFTDSTDLKVWTTAPNNDVDTANGNDTMDLALFASNPQISLNDTSYCEGEFPIVGIQSGFASYLWSTGSTGGQIQLAAGGTYTLTVTDAYGCTAVDEIEATEVASPSIGFEDEYEVCDELVLDVTNPASTYNWSNGATSPMLSITESGVYAVTVTNSTGCVNDEATLVTILEGPDVDLGSNFSLCSDLGQVQLINAGGGYMLYQWSTGETSSSINVGGPGTTPGNENISVIVTAENGCTASDTVRVTYRECLPTGVADDQSKSGIGFFPNPTSGISVLHLSNIESSEISITLTDITGRLVRNLYNGDQPRNGNLNLDLSDLNPSVYYLTVQSDQSNETISVIVE